MAVVAGVAIVVMVMVIVVVAAIVVPVVVAVRPRLTASEVHEARKYLIVLSVLGRWGRRRGCRRAVRTARAGQRYAALAERLQRGQRQARASALRNAHVRTAAQGEIGNV